MIDHTINSLHLRRCASVLCGSKQSGAMIGACLLRLFACVRSVSVQGAQADLR